MGVHPCDGLGCGLQLQVLESCSAGCSEKMYININIDLSVETNYVCVQSGKRHAFELLRAYSLHCFTAFN